MLHFNRLDPSMHPFLDAKPLHKVKSGTDSDLSCSEISQETNKQLPSQCLLLVSTVFVAVRSQWRI